MFSDFIAVCFDLLANEIAKSRYMTGGQVTIPIVVRTANGGGSRFGAQHSQSVENWVMMIPGLKVVAPSTPLDVVGLLAASIRDPDPVVFLEHKSLMADKQDVPDGEVLDELGVARVAREGHRLHHRRPCVDGAPCPGGGGSAGRAGDFCRSGRRPHARAAGHPDHPRIGEQDQPSVHR